VGAKKTEWGGGLGASNVGRENRVFIVWWGMERGTKVNQSGR